MNGYPISGRGVRFLSRVLMRVRPVGKVRAAGYGQYRAKGYRVDEAHGASVLMGGGGSATAGRCTYGKGCGLPYDGSRYGQFLVTIGVLICFSCRYPYLLS